jgi:hypothetical protein
MGDVLLVLQTLRVEHFRVWYRKKPDARRPRSRVRLRVIDRNVDRQMAVVGPVEALSDFGRVGQRAARCVEPLISNAGDARVELIEVEVRRRTQ